MSVAEIAMPGALIDVAFDRITKRNQRLTRWLSTDDSIKIRLQELE
jgi:hypothetical protein